MYLGGQKFEVKTDNNPLAYVLSTAKLDAISQRWIAALAAYDLTISYRPGHSNADADGMSRHPLLEDKPIVIENESIKALCDSAIMTPMFVENLCLSENVVDNLDILIDTQSSTLTYNIKKEQQADPVLSWWFPFINTNTLPF